MTDNLFSAILTLSLLAAGTTAVGTEMLAPDRTAVEPAPVVTLAPVTVIGKRAAADTITLPTVTVTGRRLTATEVAIDDSASERRVQ